VVTNIATGQSKEHSATFQGPPKRGPKR